MKLNLGCGNDVKKGFVNLDKIKLKGVDVVHDIEKFPWPFKNNQFDEVYCSHVLEHVDDLVKTLEEIHRISKKGAKIKIQAPYFAGQGAYNDPTHRHFFTYKTFDYFKEGGYYSKAKFKIIKRRMFFFSNTKFLSSPWFSKPFDFLINLFPILYQRAFCWIFPASEIDFLLEVVK